MDRTETIVETPSAQPDERAAAPAVRLLVCIGPRCDAEGRGRALLAELREAMTATFPTPQDAARISCTTRDCLRLCTRDPVVRIEPSGDAFSNPTVDQLRRVVAEALETSPRAVSTRDTRS